jgi:hypothetical protein
MQYARIMSAPDVVTAPTERFPRKEQMTPVGKSCGDIAV